MTTDPGGRPGTSAEENRPSVTLDGRYFFFTSNRVAEVELPPGMPPARSMTRRLFWAPWFVSLIHASALAARRVGEGRPEAERIPPGAPGPGTSPVPTSP